MATGIDQLQHAVAVGTPYDLAIIDWNMPDLDGSELAGLVRHGSSLAATSLIFTMNIGEQRIAEKLTRFGRAKHLTKPIRHRQLYDCVAALLAT